MSVRCRSHRRKIKRGILLDKIKEQWLTAAAAATAQQRQAQQELITTGRGSRLIIALPDNWIIEVGAVLTHNGLIEIY